MSGAYHYTLSGLDYIYLKSGFTVESSEYGDVISVNDVDGLHKAIGLEIVNNRQKLSGPEVKFLRKELDFSQSTLGSLLGVQDQTVANWEKGKVPIPKSSDALLRGLYLENAFGSSVVSDIIQRINDCEREAAKQEEQNRINQIDFEGTPQGWRKAA